jgi:hypothetical protein
MIKYDALLKIYWEVYKGKTAEMWFDVFNSTSDQRSLVNSLLTAIMQHPLILLTFQTIGSNPACCYHKAQNSKPRCDPWRIGQEEKAVGVVMKAMFATPGALIRKRPRDVTRF